MADALLVRTGPVNSPLDYVVPAAAEAVPRSVSATFADPTAAGPYVPAFEVVTPNGDIIGPFPLSQSVAAGASARVSWFRGVGGGGSFTPTAGTGVPPAGNLDGYIFRKTNLVIAAIGRNTQTDLLIQGNSITLDGSTSILIEYFCPLVETTVGAANQGAGVQLWDNFGGQVNKGTIGLTEYSGPNQVASVMYAAVALSPAAGTHTYALYGWKNVAASTITFYAATFIDGSGNIAAMWYRIVVIPFDPSLPA